MRPHRIANPVNDCNCDRSVRGADSNVPTSDHIDTAMAAVMRLAATHAPLRRRERLRLAAES